MAVRSLPPRPRRIRWIAYTDAATSSSILCALFFDSFAPLPTIHSCWTARPPTWCYLIRHTARILGLELLAILAFVVYFAPKYPNSCLWLYFDSNNALEAIARGDSPTDIVAITVGRIWETLQRRSIHAWFSRARSKLNPSDLPTRAILPHCPIREEARFQNIGEILIRSRRAIQIRTPLSRNSDIGLARVREPLKSRFVVNSFCVSSHYLDSTNGVYFIDLVIILYPMIRAIGPISLTSSLTQ